MKNPIEHLNKIFESRIKLGIMSVLMVNDDVSFNDLKDLLEITDGNLASHLSALEENDLIQSFKKPVGRKNNTIYKVTRNGDKAFRNHLSALENIIGKLK